MNEDRHPEIRWLDDNSLPEWKEIRFLGFESGLLINETLDGSVNFRFQPLPRIA